ncbi:hypothetical protein B0J12DRAFT_668799 [Macrophomina phaseolina]|uniref:Uncharacterized protein n=1 Tax=Macrophomina phaseolina TaxID=35725 RepID=A0ABQ8G5T3_9PEZI|nr:hypothetical protein B0J12DRAFT_668799 [Macrophomina phaseolina]
MLNGRINGLLMTLYGYHGCPVFMFMVASLLLLEEKGVLECLGVSLSAAFLVVFWHRSGGYLDFGTRRSFVPQAFSVPASRAVFGTLIESDYRRLIYLSVGFVFKVLVFVAVVAFGCEIAVVSVLPFLSLLSSLLFLELQIVHSFGPGGWRA